ncbi:LpqN/LpqT family lipoprotein [Rhodococcus sp. AW25M09]|uniref:LpqN/LpqT family lipoprotein n=1 Tax=Rhodococcus sp. AW25M09 TaxID=1268303 RepID=UPI0006875A93|nr:LpqN/LpqT family lipoprotein [Rhodococcus sp. AW25M09]
MSFLNRQGVELVPAHRSECDRFGLDLPALPGWDAVPEHLFPHATTVLCSSENAVDGFVPNAMVLVGKLTRSVDSKSLLECGFGDSRVLPGWLEVSRDRAPLRGLPSVSIAGRYEWDGHLLFARTRYVVVHHIVDQYLVQVTVTLPDSLRDRMGRLADEFVDEVRIGRG